MNKDESTPGGLEGLSFDPVESNGQDLARKEAALFADESPNLEQDGKAKEHGRYQTFRNHVNTISIIMLWVMAVVAAIAMIAWAWHMVAPEEWTWLSPSQMRDLKTFLSAAVFSSAVTGYIKNKLK